MQFLSFAILALCAFWTSVFAAPLASRDILSSLTGLTDSVKKDLSEWDADLLTLSKSFNLSSILTTQDLDNFWAAHPDNEILNKIWNLNYTVSTNNGTANLANSTDDAASKRSLATSATEDVLKDLGHHYPAKSEFETLLKKEVPDGKNLVFWSGMTPAHAEEQAAKLGGKTLAPILSKNKDWDKFTTVGTHMPFWRTASDALANHAQGEVKVLISDAAKANPKSVWNSIEKPILEKRGIKINPFDENGKPRKDY